MKKDLDHRKLGWYILIFKIFLRQSLLSLSLLAYKMYKQTHKPIYNSTDFWVLFFLDNMNM